MGDIEKEARNMKDTSKYLKDPSYKFSSHLHLLFIKVLTSNGNSEIDTHM